MSNSPGNLDWQPWRLNDLSEASQPVVEEPEIVAPPVAADENPVEDDAFLSLRQQALQQGREEGFAQGHQQGYDAGYQEGLKAGRQQGLQDASQQQQPMIEQMRQIVTEFQQTLDALDSVIPARLMQLALTAAKQILGYAPVCDGTALLNQIQQLIQLEPIFSGKPQLRVHPADLERVDQALGSTLSQHGWRLLADSQLHPGGCKVSAEEGDLDASIATRWHELCRLAAPGEL
ncbi:flagellar assembly protein FliH [Brenneria populi subsp. brevivirga]|uniref:flagellar assembly protein FliH n=1 Tax=Brenneria populi TaxID=1505588 RepID=UPI002E1975D3|nr:flagellar assembly protein FliH [Brenneria populi subsp. brevivirga]